jgi:hypothetical protein
MPNTYLQPKGQVEEGLLGNLGIRLNLRGYDGVEVDPARPASSTTTGHYGLIQQTSHGKHVAVPLAATAVTAAPTAANSVLLVDDAGLAVGVGKYLRLYDTAGTDYVNLASDANGGLVLGGSGTAAGRLFLADGAAATPSLSFTSDPNTGVYRAGPDRLGFAAGGAPSAEVINVGGGGIYLRLYDAAGTGYVQLASDPRGGLSLGGSGASGGLLYLADGSVTAPSVAFISDPNTGVYRVGADHLGLAAGGVKVVEVVSSGATFGVGIGMVPAVPLDVQRSSADWVARIDQTGSAAGAKGLQVKTLATGAADSLLSLESGGGTVRFAVGADGSITGPTWTTSAAPTVTQNVAVTVTMTRGRYRIIGKQVVVSYQLAVTSSGTAANAVTVTIPAAIQSPTTATILAGQFVILDASAGLLYTGAPYANTATGIQGIPHNAAAALGAGGFTAALANGDTIWLAATYEIL